MKYYQLIRKWVKELSRYRISIYAANASFYMILSIFPTIMIVVALLPSFGIGSKDLLNAITGFIPTVLHPLLEKILRDLDMSPLCSHKNTGETLYFRRSEEIEAFYGHAGLNRVVFDVIETKIKTLARRESQRYLNCVTSNYDRMTAVSERQIGIITRLEELQLLSSLPDELEETARLKLRYPDLPLSALAAQMTPAISKSGLSHRLKKIEEVGARLLNLTEDE